MGKWIIENTDALKAELVKLKEENKELNNTVDRFTIELDKTSGWNNSSNKELTDLKEELHQLKLDYQTAKTDQLHGKTIIADLNRKNTRLEQELFIAEQEVKKLKILLKWGGAEELPSSFLAATKPFNNSE